MDLTDKFIALRRQFTSSGELISSNRQGLSRLGSSHRPRAIWLQYGDQIENIISKVNSYLTDLSHYHREGTKVSLIQSEDDLDGKITILSNKITSEIRSAQNLIKRISETNVLDSELNTHQNISPENKIIRLNLMRQKANKIQALNKAFRGMEEKYIKKLESLDLNGAKNKGEIAKLFGEDDGLNENEIEKEQNQSLIIDDGVKKEQIEHTLSNVEQLSELFNDMKVIVVEQGTVLDRIDYQLEEAVDFADSGYMELIKTERIVDNERTKKIVKKLLLVFFVLLILNLLKAWFKRKK